MCIHLFSTFGPPIDVRLTADDFPVLIGRSDEAGLFIGDQWVSRRHCELIANGEHVRILDLGSRHGTFVNGQCVEEAWLESGDELNIGMTTLVFEGTLTANAPTCPRLQHSWA